MPKIKIRKSRSFPYSVRLLGTLAITILFGYMLNHFDENTFIIAAIIVSPVLPLLWMTVHMLEINDDQHYWWTYHWILGYKRGSKKYYSSIKSLTISPSKYQNKKGNEERRYSLVVHFSDGEVCPLAQRKNLELLKEKGQKMADKIGVELKDHT
jgi:hypothetical protein